VSILHRASEEQITERMSSVRAGLCTPTHVNVEVWEAAKRASFLVYENESYSPGTVGYVGQSGLYTTHHFVLQGTNESAYSPTFYADFWKDYVHNDALINATSISFLKNNSDYYPVTESGCTDEDELGCQDACAKSDVCTEREADGKECIVVIMMYASYDRGYLQASMSNLRIPAYFCFLGYDNAINYVVEAQARGQPVMFYHYQPDLFHQAHPKLFDRVYLPPPLPEEVAKSTGTYGENGYGNATDNPVAVDFPANTLGKYAASRILTLPVGSFISKFSLSNLDINSMLSDFANTSNASSHLDAYFSAACTWVKNNYNNWKFWIDPLPLCTYGTHMNYSVSGCNESTEARTITFSWITPDPSNESLPYTCDGGYIILPASITTSRSCAWIETYESTWKSWLESTPECDASFYSYSISDCDSSASRTVRYAWLLPSTTNETLSAECDGGVALPDDVLIGCEYMPLESPAVAVMSGLAAILAILLLATLSFVYKHRDAPIIKRSQFELLELMIVGGFFTTGAVVAYAGRPSSFLCGLRPVLISLGFTTIFGSLVVKSLRVYRVFMQKTMKRATVPMRIMLKVMVGFYLIDLAVFVVWFVADFPEPTVQTVAAKEFPGEVEEVSCRSSSFIFSGLLMFWKTILLVAGLYLSFLIRKVSVDFQESMWIFSSAVVVLFSCLVILPLAYIVDLTASAFYVFLAGMLLLSTSMVVGLMLVPKLLRLSEADTSTASSKSSMASQMSKARIVSGVSTAQIFKQSSSKYNVNPVQEE